MTEKIDLCDPPKISKIGFLKIVSPTNNSYYINFLK